MRRTIPAAALFMVTLGAALLAADNWPQWRGPELNGLSKEVGLVRNWSPTTNIAWKLPTPSRTGSTPIIWGDTIKAFDFSGSEKWTRNIEKDYGSFGINWEYASSPLLLDGDLVVQGTQKPKILWSAGQGPDVPTPVTDGTLVYIVRDNGTAFALDLKTGKVVYGSERLPGGAYSGSPVLADGHIYVTNEDGVTAVYKAGPKFVPVAQNELNDYCLSPMAVSKDRSSCARQSTCG